jgi:hypothetical protein
LGTIASGVREVEAVEELASPPTCGVLVPAVEVLGAPEFGAGGVATWAVWSLLAWVFMIRGSCVAARTIIAKAIKAPRVM